MKNNILSAIQKELIEQADPKTKDGIQRYFKEKVTGYGVKTSNVSKIAEQYLKDIKHLNKRDVFTLCEELFKTGFIEESWIACEWAYKIHRAYETGDFHIFEDWISKYINNWATCDTLCNHTIGAFIEMYPQYISNLKEWAKSSNRWFRRAAAVTLIIPAKQGEFLEIYLK